MLRSDQIGVERGVGVNQMECVFLVILVIQSCLLSPEYFLVNPVALNRWYQNSFPMGKCLQQLFRKLLRGEAKVLLHYLMFQLEDYFQQISLEFQIILMGGC